MSNIRPLALAEVVEQVACHFDRREKSLKRYFKNQVAH
jgi:hypothetical protein